MSRGAADAAHHTALVSDPVGTLTRMSGGAGKPATQVPGAAEKLAQQSETHRGGVGGSISGIPAA